MTGAKANRFEDFIKIFQLLNNSLLTYIKMQRYKRNYFQLYDIFSHECTFFKSIYISDV